DRHYRGPRRLLLPGHRAKARLASSMKSPPPVAHHGPGRGDECDAQSLSVWRSSATFRSMQLAVIGTGYVGLGAGAGFSDFGNNVVCVHVDADKIARLERGEVPIYEPGLDDLIAKNVKESRLSFTTDLAAA